MPSRPNRAALAIALTLTALLASPALAQDEPAESPAPGGEPAAVEPGSATGSHTVIDPAGTQLGTITIRDMADPFTDFEPTRPPAEGQRYVLLEVVWEAAEDQALPMDPRQLILTDANGILYQPTPVPRPADAQIPELPRQTLAPFARLIGVNGYVIPADAEVVSTVYRGDAGDRFITITQPAPVSTVAIGEATPYTDRMGADLGTITIRDVADPFTDFEPTRPPAEGTRFVMLTAAFEAAEGAAFVADPRALLLIDDGGGVHRFANVTRPPGQLIQVLEGQPLSPGDRVSGVVGFQVPTDTVIDVVVYAPEFDRVVPVADT